MSLSPGEISMSNMLMLLVSEIRDWDEATVEFTKAPHLQLHLTCQVLTKQEAEEAEDILRYWPDIEHDWVEENGTNSGRVFVLVLTRTPNKRLFGIETIYNSDGVHRRRGVIEVHGVERWLSRPKVGVYIALIVSMVHL
jgi:hypothetical protein